MQEVASNAQEFSVSLTCRSACFQLRYHAAERDTKVLHLACKPILLECSENTRRTTIKVRVGHRRIHTSPTQLTQSPSGGEPCTATSALLGEPRNKPVGSRAALATRHRLCCTTEELLATAVSSSLAISAHAQFLERVCTWTAVRVRPQWGSMYAPPLQLRYWLGTVGMQCNLRIAYCCVCFTQMGSRCSAQAPLCYSGPARRCLKANMSCCMIQIQHGSHVVP